MPPYEHRLWAPPPGVSDAPTSPAARASPVSVGGRLAMDPAPGTIRATADNRLGAGCSVGWWRIRGADSRGSTDTGDGCRPRAREPRDAGSPPPPADGHRIGTLIDPPHPNQTNRSTSRRAADGRFGRVPTCEPRDQVCTNTVPEAWPAASARSTRTGDRRTRLPNSRLTGDRLLPHRRRRRESCAGGAVLPRGEREGPAGMTVGRPRPDPRRLKGSSPQRTLHPSESRFSVSEPKNRKRAPVACSGWRGAAANQLTMLGPTESSRRRSSSAARWSPCGRPDGSDREPRGARSRSGSTR